MCDLSTDSFCVIFRYLNGMTVKLQATFALEKSEIKNMSDFDMQVPSHNRRSGGVHFQDSWTSIAESVSDMYRTYSVHAI